MAGVLLEEREVELGARAVRVHANLPGRRDQSLADERRGDAEVLQHVQGWRMKRRGAQLLVELRFGLHEQRVDARARQLERARQPDGTGTDHDDVVHDPMIVGCRLPVVRAGGW